MSYHDEIGRYFKLGRRRFLTHTGALAAASAAPLAMQSSSARAEDNVIRMMGVTTVALPDWSRFEADTGLKMEFTPIDDNIGHFYHEVKANDAGDRHDIFAQLTGVHKSLSEEGYIMPIDGSQMELWSGVSKDVTENPLLRGTTGQWGVPLVFNADTFGYFPEVLNEPRPPEPVSYDLVFNNEKTLGRVGLDDSFFSLTWAGGYMKGAGFAPDIGNPADMTPEEAKMVADFLIERKKAGQFRAFWATYEEQVSLFVNSGGGCGAVLGAGSEGRSGPGSGRRVRDDARRLRKVDDRGLHSDSGQGARQSREGLQGAQLVPGRGLRSRDRWTAGLRYC